MGGVLIKERYEGKSVQDAFSELQDDHRREKGDDYYSGGFHNCTLIAKPEADEGALDAIDSDDMYKGDAFWAVVREPKPNKNKIKSVVTRYPNKGTREWNTYYEIRDEMGSYQQQRKSQTEAIAVARGLQERFPENNYEVHIVKKLNGETRVAKTRYKPSTTEKDGIWAFKAIAPN